MIYVPNVNEFECYTMQDGYIRAYSDLSDISTSVVYTDFLYNSNYYTRSGTEELIEYPNCIPSSQLSSDIYYRTDFDKILIIFFLLSIIIIYLPIKLIFKLFSRRTRI